MQQFFIYYPYASLGLKLIDWAIGIRVNVEDEEEGLDLSQHGESGYSL